MTTRWSLPRRIAFRFAFAYVVLYTWPDPIELLPGLSHIPGFDRAVASVRLSRAVPWLTRHIFHAVVAPPDRPTGSGDTALEWARVGCVLVLAAAACVVWSLVDRKRVSYPRLADALRTLVRYVLAVTMLSYGLSKVLPLQFPTPDIAQATVRYSDFSPMGLLWKFMGYSAAYRAFGGALELTGGLLLFWRRTTTLGALLLCGVLANVVMLNFCYDVPVKQYSVHLLLVAVALAAPDVPRLGRVLVLRRPTRPPPLRVPMPVWVERLRPIAKVLVVGFILHDQASATASQLEQVRTRPMSSMYGIWNVESVEPKLPEASAWRELVVNRWGYARADWVNSETPVKWYKVDDDAAQGTLAFTPQRGGDAFSLRYTRKEDHLVLDGPLAGQNVTMRLHRVDETTLPLASRGFHWVQEQPYNH